MCWRQPSAPCLQVTFVELILVMYGAAKSWAASERKWDMDTHVDEAKAMSHCTVQLLYAYHDTRTKFIQAQALQRWRDPVSGCAAAR
jgi:hypothetical protein